MHCKLLKNFIIFGIGFFFYHPIFSELPYPSDWFEQTLVGEETKIYRHLHLYKKSEEKSFLLYELSVHPILKYEELRIFGKVEETSSYVKLFVKKCAVYAKKDFEKRWVLIRAYDCDHLVFNLETISSKEILLKENIQAFADMRFQLASTKKGITLLQIQVEDYKQLIGWGIHSRRVIKQKKAYEFFETEKLGKEINILSARESNVFLESIFPLPKYIWIPEYSSSSFLEE
ncbi:hypothetical protein [Schleiferia thermophila]